MSEHKGQQTTFLKTVSIIVSLIIVSIGWLFTLNVAMSSRIDTMSASYVTIKTQLSQIQTDLSWLKRNTK